MEERTIGDTGRLASSVFQDPRSQFFTLSSSTEIAFGLENFGFTHKEIVQRVNAAFHHFHLEHLKDRNVFELSSGERQLVAILAAWAVDTDIYLLDEPTANLDFKAIEKLQGLLRQLKEQGKTLLISEHRLYYLHDLADAYWHMDHGEIVKKYTREKMNTHSLDEQHALGLRTTNLQQLRGEARPPLPSSTVHHFHADRLSFAYKKQGPTIINDLSFAAQTGEIVGLVGHNGCGKTTFGKLCTGLLSPTSGTFTLDGQPLHKKALIANSIFIMQEAEFQFFTNSVMNECYYQQTITDEKKQEIKRLLTLCDMWHCRHQHPFSLSGGQMQKLVLLLAYLSPKPIVVLDEPTAGLDYNSLLCCTQLITEMAQTKLVLIISHDLELIAKVCTRCVSIEQGHVESTFEGCTDGLSALMHFMEAEHDTTNRFQPKERVPTPPLLDPRTKLFIFFMAAIAGVWTNIPLMLCCFGGVMLAVLYERRWGILLGGLTCMGLIIVAYLLWPGVGGSFILNFFPRIILIGAAAALLVQKSEAARSLSALRKMHVPERIIMVFSVVFRFFPVLHKDLALMSQSIKTRGFFSHLGEKLKAIPSYTEMLIVPMVFRVIRIAEALAASAETRGIALNNKRESYIAIALRPIDYCIMALTLLLVIIGLFL